MTVIAEALVETLDRFGYQTTVELLMPEFGPRMQEVIQAATGVDLAEADRHLRRLPAALLRGVHVALAPLPGADALLDALAPTGVPLGIVTSKIERGAHDLLALLGWADYFGVVVGRDTTPEMKPSPVPVRYALNALDADPARTVSVGDTEADMRAASSAGVAAIVGLTVIRAPEQMLAAGATHLCEDLDAVRALLLPALRSQPA